MEASTYTAKSMPSLKHYFNVRGKKRKCERERKGKRERKKICMANHEYLDIGRSHRMKIKFNAYTFFTHAQSLSQKYLICHFDIVIIS